MARADGDIVITVGADTSGVAKGAAEAERHLGKLNNATKAADAGFKAMAKGAGYAEDRLLKLLGVNDRLTKSASQSASVFEADFKRMQGAVDRLRASYDPVFAASKRYEAAVEQLDEALRRGVITQGQYATMTQKLGQNMLTADGAAGLMAGQVGKVGGASTRLTSQIQNASYQVGDFAVQIASGTAASRALAQQLPQLLGGFGMWGAVAGAAVAIGGALVPMFMGAAEEAKSLEDRTNDLNNAVSKFNASLADARVPLKELIEQYGRFGDEMQRILNALADADQRVVLNQIKADIDAIAASLLQTVTAREALVEGTSTRQLIDDFGLLRSEARAIEAALNALETAKGLEAQVQAAMRLVNALDSARDSAGNLPQPLEEAYAAAVQIAKQAVEVNAKINQMEGFLDAAARAADGAASAVDGIGTAANGAYGKVVKLAGAMWDLAHAQRAAEQNRQADSMVYGQVGARGDPRTSSTQGYGEFNRPTIDDYIKEFTKKDKGGGGGKKKDKAGAETQRDLEKLQKDFMTEQEVLKSQYEERLTTLKDARQKELLTEQQYQDLKLQAQKDFNDKMRAMDAAALQEKLSAWSGAFGDLSSLMNTGNKKLFKIGKAAALAQAVVDGWSAATDAWKKGMKVGGPATAAAFTAMSLARTGAMIASIRATQFDSGGTASTSAGAAAPVAAPQAPLQVRLTGDGSSIGWGDLGTLLAKLDEEAGDRGYRLLVAS